MEGRADRDQVETAETRLECLKFTLLENAAAAGATVTPAHDRPWGIYSGYFHDPDGHLWEIIWNPEGVPKPRG